MNLWVHFRIIKGGLLTLILTFLEKILEVLEILYLHKTVDEKMWNYLFVNFTAVIHDNTCMIENKTNKQNKTITIQVFPSLDTYDK